MYIKSYSKNNERDVYQMLCALSGNPDKVYDYRKNIPEDIDGILEKLQQNTEPDEGEKINRKRLYFQRFYFRMRIEREQFKEIADFILGYFQSAQSCVAVGYYQNDNTVLDIFMDGSFLKGTGYETMEEEILKKAADTIGTGTEIRYSYRIYCAVKGKEKWMEYCIYCYEHVGLEQLAEYNAKIRTALENQNQEV